MKIAVLGRHGLLGRRVVRETNRKRAVAATPTRNESWAKTRARHLESLAELRLPIVCLGDDFTRTDLETISPGVLS